MKIILVYVFLLIISIFNSCSNQTQEIGRIYSRTEANRKFGKIIRTYTFDNTRLDSLLTKTGKYIGFSAGYKNFFISGQNRTSVYPMVKEISKSEPLRIYSTDMVKRLITLGKESSTMIEYRDSVITLTNGNYTLEESILCPPICP